MVGMVDAQFEGNSEGTVFYPYPYFAGRIVPPGLEATIRGEAEWSRYACFSCVIASPLLANWFQRAHGHGSGLIVCLGIMAIYLMGYTSWAEFRTARSPRVSRKKPRPRRAQTSPGKLFFGVVVMSAVFALSTCYFVTRQGMPNGHPAKYLPGVILSGLLLAIVASRRVRR